MGLPFASTDPLTRTKPGLRRARLVMFFCLGGLFAVAGCGERRVAVSGKATVDGKPLTTSAATILFAPDKDNPLQKIPSAVLDANGMYHVSTGDKEGVPLGWYKVYVAFDVKKSKGVPVPFHPKYLDAATSPLSVQVVANPPPGAYDLKLTEK